MRSLRSLIVCAGLLGAAFALTGCGSTPRNPDVNAATPGVTVYGTVDAGIGRAR